MEAASKECIAKYDTVHVYIPNLETGNNDFQKKHGFITNFWQYKSILMVCMVKNNLRFLL